MIVPVELEKRTGNGLNKNNDQAGDGNSDVKIPGSMNECQVNFAKK